MPVRHLLRTVLLGANDFLQKGLCYMGIVVGDVIAAVSLLQKKPGNAKPGVYICPHPLQAYVCVYLSRDTAAAWMSLCLEVVFEVLGFGGESCKQLGRLLVEELLCN